MPNGEVAMTGGDRVRMEEENKASGGKQREKERANKGKNTQRESDIKGVVYSGAA